MKKVINHLKRYIIRGILAVIPLVLTYFALKILYNSIDQRAVKIIEQVIGINFPGLGLLLVLASLYILGLVASNVIGRHLFGLLEKMTKNIPLVRTTYKVGQQLGVTLSLPDKQVFKRAVLVEYRGYGRSGL